MRGRRGRHVWAGSRGLGRRLVLGAAARASARARPAGRGRRPPVGGHPDAGLDAERRRHRVAAIPGRRCRRRCAFGEPACSRRSSRHGARSEGSSTSPRSFPSRVRAWPTSQQPPLKPCAAARGRAGDRRDRPFAVDGLREHGPGAGIPDLSDADGALGFRPAAHRQAGNDAARAAPGRTARGAGRIGRLLARSRRQSRLVEEDRPRRVGWNAGRRAAGTGHFPMIDRPRDPCRGRDRPRAMTNALAGPLAA